MKRIAHRFGLTSPQLSSSRYRASSRRVGALATTALLGCISSMLSSAPAGAQTSNTAPTAAPTTGPSSPDGDRGGTAPAPAAATSTATPPGPAGVDDPATSATPPVAGATESAPRTPHGSTPPPYPEAPPPYPEAPAADPRAAVQAGPASADDPAIYEPPLPAQSRVAAPGTEASVDGAPLPPPPSKHVAPRASLWVGARPGVFVPMGAMWLDGEPVGSVCCSESVRPFSEFAGVGPSLGLDLGVRFARHYQAFAFWERGWLGAGTLENAFGGQSDTSTSMFGGGFRFSTHPDAIGMVVEISIGYRTFEAEWERGTRLTAADDLFSTRLGFGVEWRVNRLTTLELLLMAGGGAFTDVEWKFADDTTRNALTGYDRYGQYIPFGIQLASHWDVISSDD